MQSNALRLFTLCCLAALPSASQTTFATITGTVTDPNGLVVPGAGVEATHVQSNYAYKTQTNQAGAYTFSQLREGDYRVRVTAAGFREYIAEDVRLSARDIRRIDARLEIGAVQAAIEVSAGGATLIETETARIMDVKSNEQLMALPLSTRSAMDFLQQTPGVLRRTGNLGFTIRFAGSRSNQEDETIDGISFNNGVDGTFIGILGNFMESVAEMRVDMAGNTAELGSLGQFTLVSKSGGNQLHASLFDYYSAGGLQARNPFSPERPQGVQHYPGGSISGPVYLPRIYDGRNKTFFFFSYEGERGSAISELLNPTVPAAAWRGGDFSNLGASAAVRDPLSRTPFPGNRIPTSRLNPVSLKIQDRFYPLPNFGDPNVFQSQNYREQKLRPFDTTTLVVTRIDHRFSEKAFMFGRYTWGRKNNNPFEGNLPTIGTRYNPRTTPAANVSFSYMIRPTLVNEVRWGYTFQDNPAHGPVMALEQVRELGLVGLAPDLPDVPGMHNVTFTGIGLEQIAQQLWRDPGNRMRNHQFQDHLSWYRGRHTVKAGFLMSRYRFSVLGAGSALFGWSTFSNRFTGHPYADFLLGIPTTAQRDFPPLLNDRTRWNYDFFVTDDFKVSPRLTLNVGLRYEYHPSWVATNGLNSIFDVATGSVVVPNGMLSQVSPLMPRGYVPVIEASQAGLPSGPLVRGDRNNFAPRIGVAYRPWGNNTVIRAGYGIYFDVVPRGVSSANVPFAIREPAYTNPANAPDVIFPRVFPDTVAGPGTVALPDSMRPDLRIPYSMQYTFTLEHQRWSTGFRLSYVGTNTRQGEYTYDINQPVADGRLYADKPRLFPQYPNIPYATNGGGHQYHGFTAQVRRPLARGLSYQFAFEWARDIGDLERGQSPEDAYDLRRERGVWIDIPTYRVTSNVIYELPVGKGKRYLAGANRVVRNLIGNWEVSAIYDYYSGQFLTPQWTGPDPVGTVYTASRTPAQRTIRPNHLRDANLDPDERTTARWFDVSAFGAPTAGSLGNAAKGVIKGPTVSALHAGLGKSFELTERLNLRLQIKASNAFNHPNWANPNTNITSRANVGVIRGVGSVSQKDMGGPRLVMLGARLDW